LGSRDNVITPTLNTPTVITPTLITPTIITSTLNTSTVTDSLCNSGAFSKTKCRVPIRFYPWPFDFRLKREYRENIYFTFIRPILEYSYYGQVISDRLEKLQLEAARIVTGLAFSGISTRTRWVMNQISMK
jgi:hypothetical protein